MAPHDPTMFSRRPAGAGEVGELRGNCPKSLLSALDALAMARNLDRTAYVNQVLDAHVADEVHKASVLVRTLRAIHSSRTISEGHRNDRSAYKAGECFRHPHQDICSAAAAQPQQCPPTQGQPVFPGDQAAGSVAHATHQQGGDMSIALMTLTWQTALPLNQKAALLALSDWANDEGASLHPSIYALSERLT